MQRWAKSLEFAIFAGNRICNFDLDMKNLKEYSEPALRVVDIRFEQALLQASGWDRADDGYDPGIDLGDLD